MYFYLAYQNALSLMYFYLCTKMYFYLAYKCTCRINVLVIYHSYFGPSKTYLQYVIPKWSETTVLPSNSVSPWNIIIFTTLQMRPFA